MDDNTRLILESLMVICNAIADIPEARGIVVQNHATRCAGRGAAIAKRLREHDEATAKFGKPAPTNPVYETARVVAKMTPDGIPTYARDVPTPTANEQARLLVLMATAKQIVANPPPPFGYVDIGDALVEYLRGRRDADETIQIMNGLAESYDRDRQRAGA
jgi:hypothetical protein